MRGLRENGGVKRWNKISGERGFPLQETLWSLFLKRKTKDVSKECRGRSSKTLGRIFCD
jgi:hypothetical protein